jgi:hypothetical protein
LKETWSSLELLEAQCRQVKICTEIALSCLKTDRHERPSIVHIINELNETETFEKVTNCAQDPSPLSSTSNIVQPAASSPPSTQPPPPSPTPSATATFSNVLVLDHDEIDITWDAKNQLPENSKAEVCNNPSCHHNQLILAEIKCFLSFVAKGSRCRRGGPTSRIICKCSRDVWQYRLTGWTQKGMMFIKAENEVLLSAYFNFDYGLAVGGRHEQARRQWHQVRRKPSHQRAGAYDHTVAPIPYRSWGARKTIQFLLGIFLDMSIHICVFGEQYAYVS